MALATLSIDLVAKLASFEADLGKASRLAEQNADRMERAFASVGSAVRTITGALAGVVSVEIFRSIITGAIDAADHLNDLSKVTGISVETLGGIGFAATQAGADLDGVAASLGKLNLTIAKAADGSKEEIAAFRAMRVEFKELDGAARTGDAVFADIAEKFAGYADGPEKAALANALFGKSYASVIPLLNDGGKSLQENTEYYRRFGGVTAETAAAADQFNDTLGKVNLISGSFGRTLSVQLLPALQSIADALLSAKEQGGGFEVVAEGIRRVLETVAVVGANVGFVLLGLGREIGAIAAQGAALARLDFSGFSAISDAVKEDGVKARQELDKFTSGLQRSAQEIKEIGERNRLASLLDGGFDGPTRQRAAPRLSSLSAAATSKGSGAAKGIDRAAKLYDDLIARVKERATLAQLELTNSAKLTDAQRFEMDIKSKLEGKEIKLTDAQRKGVLAQLAQASAVAQQVDTRNLLRQAMDAQVDAEQRALESLEAAAEARVSENRSIALQIEALGLNGRQIEALTIKRLEDSLAIEENEIAIRRANGAGASELIVLREKADALRRQIDLRQELAGRVAQSEDDPNSGAARALKDYQDEVNKRGLQTYSALRNGLDGFESRLSEFFVRGKADWKGYFEAIAIEQAKVRLVQPLVKAGIDFLGGSASSFLGSIFGGGRAFGGPVSAGKLYEINEGGGPGEILNAGGRQYLMASQNGTVTPQSGGGGGAGATSFNFSIDARGADAGVEARIQQGVRQAVAQSLVAVQQAANRGGSFARAVGRR